MRCYDLAGLVFPDNRFQGICFGFCNQPALLSLQDFPKQQWLRANPGGLSNVRVVLCIACSCSSSILVLLEYHYQRDHKGPEFRTWSGSGPKCQNGPKKVRISDIGPDFLLKPSKLKKNSPKKVWILLKTPDFCPYRSLGPQVWKVKFRIGPTVR